MYLTRQVVDVGRVALYLYPMATGAAVVPRKEGSLSVSAVSPKIGIPGADTIKLGCEGKYNCFTEGRLQDET